MRRQFTLKVVGWAGAATVVAVSLMLANSVAAGNENVQVPSNHGYSLDQALGRLHAAGLKASFPNLTTRCGAGLPAVNIQSPRSPARVADGTSVSVSFIPQQGPLFSPPKFHRKWLTVPSVVGLDYRTAQAQLTGLWPCLNLVGASSTFASNVVVVSQAPKAGSRVRAYGVKVKQGFHPTLIHLTVAAR